VQVDCASGLGAERGTVTGTEDCDAAEGAVYVVLGHGARLWGY